MLALSTDPKADQKRLILLARKAKWTTAEICRALGVSTRTLRAREAEIRQAQQEALLVDRLREYDRAAC
jgi:DNA-directed RNA polymerase specialized sigma24 family protein